MEYARRHQSMHYLSQEKGMEDAQSFRAPVNRSR
jgi:hypothetical protein